MMKRMSFSETIFLFFLALVIFGPKKLPEIARQAGKLLNEFRRASNEFKSQIEQEIAHLEVEEKKKADLPPAAPPEGTASRTLSQPSTTALPETSAASSDLPSGDLPSGDLPSTALPTSAEDEPLFAANSEVAASEVSQTVPRTHDAASTTPQESHV
jgi:sec-independent protein translocase protein TatB